MATDESANSGRERDSPDDPDTIFSCTECDWIGPAEDVEWGEWIPAHYRGQRMEPTKNDCPECGSEVENQQEGVWMPENSNSGSEQNSREITVRRHYRCPEGHLVIVDGSYFDPHNAVALDLHCAEHGSWMQPVPAPEADDE